MFSRRETAVIDIIDDVMHMCNAPRLASQSSSRQEAPSSISLDIKQVPTC